jgi:hypothetical protein
MQSNASAPPPISSTSAVAISLQDRYLQPPPVSAHRNVMPASNVTVGMRHFPAAGRRQEWWSPGTPARVCFVAYVCIVLAMALTAPFPNHFDELAHLSYVAAIAQHGLAGLDLYTMRLLSPGLSEGFTSDPSYLNHPPGYYLLLRPFLPPDGWPTLETVRVLRVLNACLSSLAVACALGVGVLRRFEPRMLLAYSLMIIMTPVLWPIGGAINNDNLAYLGGGVCVLGAQLLQLEPNSRSGRTLLIAGCTVAMLAKLTAGIMAVGFAGIFIVTLWRVTGKRPPGMFVFGLLAAVGLACLPYLWFIAIYGSPAPVTPAYRGVYDQVATLFSTYPDLHTHGWVAGQHLSLAGYSRQFMWWLLADWNPVLGMKGALSIAILLVPSAVLLLAGAAWLRNWRPVLGQDQVIFAGGIALAMVLPLHLAFSYKMYCATGAPPFDAVPRYYFPLALTVLPAAACWSLSRIRQPIQPVLCWILIIGLALAPIAIFAGGLWQQGT